MTSTPQEISSNISFDVVRGNVERTLTNPKLLYGDRYTTAISPEYSHVYRDSIYFTIGGLVLDSVGPLPLANGEETEAAVFGFVNVPLPIVDGLVHLIIPVIYKNFLHLLDDVDPSDALHGFHVNLIKDTNKALSIADSHYRLTPLPPV